jgi:hypothetical protein
MINKKQFTTTKTQKNQHHIFSNFKGGARRVRSPLKIGKNTNWYTILPVQWFEWIMKTVPNAGADPGYQVKGDALKKNCAERREAR